ncbi:phosphoenolpyruvate--protein phosphotransferase [Burkholderia sp. FERM BP-3421]|uniref:phosphoenolpyruvate--protein phosphotransferase n=1 Tax=Burkholderia sp. FERM BP-3421 TaxID=1494466 RepID=UPI002361439F|nr:phosphoenolpyruvate--protein phosphotransferase [Burkholderia sp. FERM BP-3421]WDD92026.1 phosphoenolpyruvate--protein phosphotransferase [Burkholderia sp. FERM BP-3421]
MLSKQIQMSVLAPLSGTVVPIEAVPDPAFAQKMVGDGLSINPQTNIVLSPIAGRVIDLHASRHAVVVEGEWGVRVMVHVGIDTVMLDGEGFDALVAKGDDVLAGQPLLRFDLAHVAAYAASMLTEIVVVNSECVSRMDKSVGAVEAGKSVLLTLHLASQTTGGAAPEQDGEWLYSPFILLPNPAGLHARPASVLAREARQFSAHVVLSCGALDADAKSAVDVMALATGQGDEVCVSARGGDAAQALERLVGVLLDGCGERIDHVAASGPRWQDTARAAAADAAVGTFAGVGASPGLAVGSIVQWRGAELEFDEAGGTFDDERPRLSTALRLAGEQIQALVAGGGESAACRAEIMDAHLALLEDPVLLDAAEANLRTGASAPGAWYQACQAVARRLAGHPSPLLRERATDIRDVGTRVLSLLTGVRRAMPVFGDRSIVLADDLTPSDTVSLDRSKVIGLCTVSGGPTSHVAILARSMGIPAICGIDAEALSLSDGATAVLDGTAGLLRIDPDPELLADVTRRMDAEVAERRANEQAAHRIGSTRDGHRVEVVANVRDVVEAKEAVASGAEGVGLLRSEFLFEDRATAPDENEQAAAYEAIAAELGRARKFVVRTLDVGGDKPLRYLPLPKEANPFLGLRGIRVSLAYPELFRNQLRAMLRAAPHGDLHIMFPMVSDLNEVLAAKCILQDEQQKYPHPVKIGVMVEVPAAVAIVEALAREVDFFSIGTNDLAQYTLAIDRGHAKLSSQVDTLHPAVLKMIDLTVAGAHAHGKWVGVCGAMASDPATTAILVGLGVDELSVSVPAIAAIKAELAKLDFDACRALARRVLKLGSARQVRDAIVGGPAD